MRKHVGDEEYTCVLCGTVQEVSIDDAISCAELISIAFANGDLSKLNELKLPVAIESYSSSKRVTHCGKDKTLREIALDVLNNPMLNQSAAQDQAKRVLDRKSLINKFLCPLDGNVIGQNKSLLDPSTPIKDIGPDQFAEQYFHSTSDQCHSRDYKFRSLIIEMLERALALGCYSSEDVQRFKLLTEHMSRQSYNHLPGLDYQLVPSFVCDLYHYGNGDGIFERQNNSAKLNENAIAYIFSILTAARSQAVRLMQWQEIDFARGIWTIPIAHDKIKEPNRIRSIVLSSLYTNGEAKLTDDERNEIISATHLAIKHIIEAFPEIVNPNYERNSEETSEMLYQEQKQSNDKIKDAYTKQLTLARSVVFDSSSPALKLQIKAELERQAANEHVHLQQTKPAGKELAAAQPERGTKTTAQTPAKTSVSKPQPSKTKEPSKSRDMER